MSAAEDSVLRVDVCSPSKKYRTNDTQNDSSFASSFSMATASAQVSTSSATAVTATSVDTKVLARDGFAIDLVSSSPQSSPTVVVGGSRKDSTLSHILGHAFADSECHYAEGSPMVGLGVVFDDSCYHGHHHYAFSAPGRRSSCAFSPPGTWTDEQHGSASTSRMQALSLLVMTESRGCNLQHNIEQVMFNHKLIICDASEALALTDQQVFQLIWIVLPHVPTEDVLAVITGIRYNSKLNRKTVQIGVAATLPDVDLHLHGIDEIVLEPVSKATIYQKYFVWTSVKLKPDFNHTGLSKMPTSPTTPDSGISTESNVDLSLSLISDMASDGGIRSGNQSDLEAPQYTSSAYNPSSSHTLWGGMCRGSSDGSPSNQPPWCRAEHATKEKQRRERIKDSCDQLRVLLPYVRGRKTDMASILEMTVDYLKIVNSKLPHEFHAHVLDIMTKSGDSPPAERPARAQGRTPGRGGRRGKGGKKAGASSPVCTTTLPTTASHSTSCSSPVKTSVETVLSRGTSTNASTMSSRGKSGARSTKMTRRGSGGNVVMAVNNSGVVSPCLPESKERGGAIAAKREESVIANCMVQPTYIQPALQTNSHIFTHHSISSSQSFAVPAKMGSLPSTTECSLYPAGLFAHGVLPQAALSSPQIRYTISSERESTLGGIASFGDSPPTITAYYHYFSNVAESGPPAACGIAGASTVGGPSCAGDFISAGPLLTLSTPSAFAPPSSRLQMMQGSCSSASGLTRPKSDSSQTEPMEYVESSSCRTNSLVTKSIDDK